MSMALQIRVDELAREVGELRRRLEMLEGMMKPPAVQTIAQMQPPFEASAADEHNAAVEGDDFPAKRGPGRPRKQS